MVDGELTVDKSVYITYGSYSDSVLSSMDIEINNKMINRVEITYRNISSGGAYNSNLRLSENLQNKILKIIYTNLLDIQIIPLNMKQILEYESINNHYFGLTDIYVDMSNKSLILWQINKTT